MRLLKTVNSLPLRNTYTHKVSHAISHVTCFLNPKLRSDLNKNTEVTQMTQIDGKVWILKYIEYARSIESIDMKRVHVDQLGKHVPLDFSSVPSWSLQHLFQTPRIPMLSLAQ